jgi:ribosomal protein S6
MKKVSLEVVNHGGIVRSIQNHGIRDIPHRMKAKYADQQGNRYYELGRYISIYYDSNPTTMRQVEQIFNMSEDILRTTHLKARSIVDYVNITKEDRNPYIKEVLKQLKQQHQRKQQQKQQSFSPTSTMVESSEEVDPNDVNDIVDKSLK